MRALHVCVAGYQRLWPSWCALAATDSLAQGAEATEAKARAREGGMASREVGVTVVDLPGGTHSRVARADMVVGEGTRLSHAASLVHGKLCASGLLLWWQSATADTLTLTPLSLVSR